MVCLLSPRNVLLCLFDWLWTARMGINKLFLFTANEIKPFLEQTWCDSAARRRILRQSEVNKMHTGYPSCCVSLSTQISIRNQVFVWTHISESLSSRKRKANRNKCFERSLIFVVLLFSLFFVSTDWDVDEPFLLSLPFILTQHYDSPCPLSTEQISGADAKVTAEMPISCYDNDYKVNVFFFFLKRRIQNIFEILKSRAMEESIVHEFGLNKGFSARSDLMYSAISYGLRFFALGYFRTGRKKKKNMAR